MKRNEQKATAVLSRMAEILEISTEIDTPFTLSLISMHSLLYIYRTLQLPQGQECNTEIALRACSDGKECWCLNSN